MNPPLVFTTGRKLFLLLAPALTVIAVLIALPFGQNGWITGPTSWQPTGQILACRGDCSR